MYSRVNSCAKKHAAIKKTCCLPSGLVRQPLNLTRNDLRRFQMAEVQINDVKADGDYQGVFVFRGVPLKTLLEQATIAKESAVFRREMDLAIVVRSRSGRRTV